MANSTSWRGATHSTFHLPGRLRHSFVQTLTGIDDENPAQTLAGTGGKGTPLSRVNTLFYSYSHSGLDSGHQGARRTSSGRGMRGVRYGPSRKREEHSRITPSGGDDRFRDQSTVYFSHIMQCIDAGSTHSSLEGQRVTALRASVSARSGPF